MNYQYAIRYTLHAPPGRARTKKPFYAKQTQFPPILRQKRGFCPKTNPIQTQFKPNSKPIQSQSNPIQSQFKANSNPIPQRDTQYEIRDTRYKPNSNPIPQRDTQYEIRDTRYKPNQTQFKTCFAKRFQQNNQLSTIDNQSFPPTPACRGEASGEAGPKRFLNSCPP